MSIVVKRIREGSPEPALVAFSHPNIVSMVEARDGEVVMERAEGGSLHDLLAERPRLAPAMVTTIGLGIAAALGEIHRRGLVHGDVHPGNVLFDARMTPLLADFGALRVAGMPGPGQGARGFTAPEIARGLPASPQADQWSLASTLRACLGPLIPTPVAVVLAVALAPDPEDRFPTVGALAQALRNACPPQPLEPRSGPVRGASPPVTRRYGPRPPRAALTHRRPGPVAVATAALLAVLAGTGLLRVPFLAGGTDRRPATTMAPAPPRPECADQAPPDTVPGDRVLVACGVTAVQRGTDLLVSLDGVAHRYRIGEPGDVVLLGDWDCDGRPTPGLYRPSSGRVLLFGTWDATATGVGPIATAELAPNATPFVTDGTGCDTITVTD